jgi:phosphotransferase system enzyme I (PtsI)
VRLIGLGVSPGLAVGYALVLTHRALDVRFRVAEADVPRELERIERAKRRARRQLEEIRARVARAAGAPGDDTASLFDAHLLMIEDPMLTGRAAALVREERVNAEWALRRAADELMAAIDQAEDDYLRERKGDIADVAGRLRLNLRAGRLTPAAGALARVTGPVILVTDELSASVAAQVDWSQVAGFVSDAGSWTYHTAILARSLRLPAIVGLRDASAVVPPGAPVAIDGGTGEVLVEPSDDDVAGLRARERLTAASARAPDEDCRLPAVTPDGLRVRLEANLELADEVVAAREQGVESIGLYRSEFLLARVERPMAASPSPPVDPDDPREEDRQYDVYRRVLETMAPGRVTIRTLDAKDDDAEGEWPRRGRGGLRGLRLSLARTDVFRTQLRALFRAARHGTLRIMFPFVTGVEELREGRRLAAQVAGELRSRGETIPDVPIGAMIEVPSAAVAADLMAAHADFLSVGTNDLVQFTLAVDRDDERVSTMYDPLHPAILRLVRTVVRGARRRGVPLALCGEMAADPAMAVLLVGLGVTELSMRPAAIPLVTRVLRETRAADARRLAARALGAATAAEVERELASELSRGLRGVHG